MPISIYNYAESKIPLILEMTSNTTLRNLQGSYYLDNDWQHGPNTLVVFRNGSEERFLVDEIKEFVRDYINRNPINHEYLRQKQQLYREKQRTLVELEYRDNVDINLLHEHGHVLSRPRKSGIYNSKQHRKTFDKYRCDLNDIYLKILEKYHELSIVERAHLFLHQFRFIASLYEDGPKNGHLTFLSHAQGFLSNIEARGLNSNIKINFEKKRTQLFHNNEIILRDDIIELMQEWEARWTNIAMEMNDRFSIDNYDDPEEGVGLKPQLELLKRELAPLNNEFHTDLLSLDETGELEQFLHSKKMLVFRDIVNLFYLSLPLFEQSMAEKQFYAYSVVKYYDDYFNGEVLYKI